MWHALVGDTERQVGKEERGVPGGLVRSLAFWVEMS